MVGHHGNIGAPLLLESDEHTHADRVYASLSHTVESVAAPFKAALHAAGMVELVVLAVVGLLKADDTIEAVVGQFLVLLHLQRHHLDLDVREIALGNVDGLGQIGHSRLGWVLACDEEDVFKGCQLFDGTVFVLYLLRGEDSARHGVLAVETAIDARVGARVGDIERDEHRHGASETLLGVFARESGHLLQVWLGSGREQGHEVVDVAMTLAQGTTHVGIGHGGDTLGGLLPTDIF